MRYAVHSLVAVSLVLVTGGVARAHCPRGETLIFEDDYYWHCAVEPSSSEVSRTLESAEFVGDNYRYRKALVDALRQLKGQGYKLGAKWDFTIDGRTIHFCAADGCDGPESSNTIDCSGAVAYAELSACISTAICRSVYPELRLGVLGETSNAAGIASFFYRSGAYNTQRPQPGDLIFFDDGGRAIGGRRGITHVAVYLGRVDDKLIVFHAVGHPKNKAVFEKLDPAGDLASRVVGFGNVTKLVHALAN